MRTELRNFNLNGGGIRLSGAATLATAVMVLAGCPSNGPKRIDIGVNPDGGHITWGPDGGPGSLPTGWTPDGSAPLQIPLPGGGHVTITVCVARNSGDPNCLYVKMGPCDVAGSWQKYCKDVVIQSQTEGGAACATSGEIEISGSTVTVTFEVCRDITVSDELVGTYLWDESENEFIASTDWRSTYGDTADDGTTIKITGNGATVAFDSYLIGVGTFSFEDGTDVYEGGVLVTSDGLPFAAVTLNGNVVDKRVVSHP